MDSKSKFPDTSSLPNVQPRPQNQPWHIVVIDDQILPQLQVNSDGLTKFLPLSKILAIKNKRNKLYIPMDFRELIIDGLIDKSALSSGIPEADLRKILLPAAYTILKEGPPSEFRNMVVNGQLEQLFQQ